VLDVVQLAAVMAAHMMVSWVYLIWSVCVSPKLTAKVEPSGNPFATKLPENPMVAKAPENPFAANPADEK
jgi:hypothetical protein